MYIVDNNNSILDFKEIVESLVGTPELLDFYEKFIPSLLNILEVYKYDNYIEFYTQIGVDEYTLLYTIDGYVSNPISNNEDRPYILSGKYLHLNLESIEDWDKRKAREILPKGYGIDTTYDEFIFNHDYVSKNLKAVIKFLSLYYNRKQLITNVIPDDYIESLIKRLGK